MNRFGLKEEVKEFFEFYEKQDKVKMIGVYSHFATTMRNRKKYYINGIVRRGLV